MPEQSYLLHNDADNSFFNFMFGIVYPQPIGAVRASFMSKVYVQMAQLANKTHQYST